MNLGELIDFAIDGYNEYGDLRVVLIDGNGNVFNDMTQLKLWIADVQLNDKKSPKETVFAFMPDDVKPSNLQ